MSESNNSSITDRNLSKTEQLIRSDLAKNQNNIAISKPGFLKRKGRKIKKLFSDWWVLGKTGFVMGGIVGGVMGFLGGCVSAYQTKSLIMIPISMIGSGCFFASLMSIGACLRSDDIDNNKIVFYKGRFKNNNYLKHNNGINYNNKYSLNNFEIIPVFYFDKRI